MQSSVALGVLFAASIAAAASYPSRNYYGPVSFDDGEYSGGRGLWTPGQSYSLSSAPFYYQARTLDLDEAASRARKYQVVKKKKNQVAPGSDEEDDEPQDDEESSEEEGEDEEEDEEESMDIPAWDKLFPEEDKNTGTFQDPSSGGGYGSQQGGYGGQGGQYGGQSGGYGGQGGYSSGGSLANIPGGAPAPEGSSTSSLMNFFGGGSSTQSGGNSGQQGGPPQYRRGPPPKHFQRARATIQEAEEPRSGGAVLYDGYRYIPVNQVLVQQRQAKKIKAVEPKEKSRTLVATPAKRQQKKLSTTTPTKNKFVLVPVQRDNREIRFSRDEDGFRVEGGSFYAPTEIWRWEGPGGRPLRRRENRPSGLYYAPRPNRGSSSIRFNQHPDY